MIPYTIYYYFFLIESFTNEVRVPFHSLGVSVVSFSTFFARFLTRTESKLSHMLLFSVLFCFVFLFVCVCFLSALLDWAELALTTNKSLSYLLFFTHIIYKALYSIDTKADMSHILSKCCNCSQFHEHSHLLWRSGSDTWKWDILILTVQLGNVYIHWLLLSHCLLWTHAHTHTQMKL